MSKQLEFIFPEEFDTLGLDQENYLLYLWLLLDEPENTDNQSDQPKKPDNRLKVVSNQRLHREWLVKQINKELKEKENQNGKS